MKKYEKDILILLESNYSYLITLTYLSFLNKEDKIKKSIVLFSDLKKTKNFKILSNIRRKIPTLPIFKKSLFLKKVNNLFFSLMFGLYLFLFFIFNRKIKYIYTSCHSLSSIILFKVLKLLKLRPYLFLVDDGTYSYSEKFLKSNSYKNISRFSNAIMTKQNNILNINYEIFDLKNSWNKLEESQKKYINYIFNFKDIGNIDVLLLTQPFVVDGILKTYSEKNELYIELLKNNDVKEGEQVYIKMHPREIKKVKLKFWKIEFIEKSTPFELYVLNGVFFKRIISFNSTSIFFTL